ncbi:MAG: HAD hydrolase-like protein, partial [Sulfurovum sp.]
MDGTLVNSSLTIANAINYVRKNLGFEALEQEYILRLVND